LPKQDFLQTIGTLLNTSSQASKIMKTYDGLSNPIYQLNDGFLQMADRLSGIAQQGQPAVLALRMLGPTASMHQLNNLTMQITQGIMRYQSVVMAAAVVAAGAYGLLFNAAKGPDVTEVLDKRAEILKDYKKQVSEAFAAYNKAVQDRTAEIAATWSLFEKAEYTKLSAKEITNNLAGQVKALEMFNVNMQQLASKIPEGLAKELGKLGPKAAGTIANLNNMSKPELNKYVALWQEKQRQAKEIAVREHKGMKEDMVKELSELKKQTDSKVKDLMSTLTPLGLALEPLKSAWAGAFKPMVELFGQILAPVVNFIAKIGELITKFNEAHPMIAKIIAGFLMLIPALTLILAPMAIGIGLFNGMAAAFGSVWIFIEPIITGLAAMMGTVLAVAAVIAVLIGVFVYLWKTNESFRTYIINAWNSIKAAAIAAWNYIYKNVIVPVVNAVKAFIMQIWGQIKTWWDANQKGIMAIVKVVWMGIQIYLKTVMTVIMVVFKTVWNIIKNVVVAVWDNIKGIISGAVTIVLNIISVFTNLLSGNWKGVWESVKNIVKGAWQIVANIIGGAANIILGLIKGLADSIGGKFKEMATSFYNAGRGFIEQMVKGIQSMIGKVLDTIGNVAKKVRDFLPFSPAKVGPLSDLNKLDFGGPIEDSINNALPRVQGAMTRMLKMPDIKPNMALAGSNTMLAKEFASIRENEQKIEVPVVVDGREIARATATHMGRELNKIAATKQRASGNK
jgi:phage-related protein